jgi:hypothetical protein
MQCRGGIKNCVINFVSKFSKIVTLFKNLITTTLYQLMYLLVSRIYNWVTSNL